MVETKSGPTADNAAATANRFPPRRDAAAPKPKMEPSVVLPLKQAEAAPAPSDPAPKP